MRRKVHKILLVVLVMAIAAGCFAFAACGNKPAEQTPVISVGKSIDVTVGESVKLTPTVLVGKEKKDGGTYTYKSADITVASVSTDGTVHGNKVGSTKVTVSCTYEGTALTPVDVDVNVTEPADVPVLNPEIFVSFSKVSLAVGEDGKHISAVVVDGERVLSGGEFTYESADTSVATVSSAGLIEAVAKGETTVTVSGTYEGKTLDAVILPVEVYEVMTINTGIENNALELYSGAGRDTDNPFVTSKTITPVVTLTGAEINNATVTLTTQDNEVVGITDNTTITALKAGSAKVTVTATAPSGTTESAEISVTVRKPYSAIEFDNPMIISLESGKSVEWSEFGIADDVIAIRVEGKTVDYTLESGKLSLSDGAVGAGLTMQIETEQELFNAEVTVATMAIADRNDFVAFRNKMPDLCNASKTPQLPYVVLTDDIDCSDSSYEANEFAWQPLIGGWVNNRSNWRGVLDGMGHTINNIRIEAAFMFTITEDGVIKNLSVTNIERYRTERGIVAGEMKGTVENCYFHLGSFIDTINTNAWLVPFATQVTSTAVVKNVVVSIPDYGNNKTYESYKGKNAIMQVTAGATIENLFVISKENSGKLTDKDEYNKAANGGMFENVWDFYQTAHAKANQFDDCWAKTDTLIFDSAIQFFTPESGVGKTVTPASELLVGGSVKFSTNFTAVAWSLKTPVDGVSVDNGVITVNAQVADGTKVTVIATGYDPTLCTTYNAESEELTVSDAENVKFETKYTSGANRKGEKLVLDLSEKNITTITSVSFDYKKNVIVFGTTDTFDTESVSDNVVGYKFADSMLEIDPSVLGMGDGEIVIACQDANGKKYVFHKEFEKVDFAIGNAEELNQLADKLKELNLTSSLPANGKSAAAVPKGTPVSSYLTVVLTDDIDYAGANFVERTGKVEFAGSFDGRGHTIYNMHGTNSLFVNLNGLSATGGYTVFKNVAFVGGVVTATNTPYLTKAANWGTGAWFIYRVNKTNMHDVYVDVTVKNCKDPNFGMFRATTQTSTGHYSLYGNIVGKVTYDESCSFKALDGNNNFTDTDTNLTAVITNSQASGFINVYIVSNKAPDIPEDENDTSAIKKTNGCFSYANATIGVGGKDARNNLNVHYYATVEELMAHITALPALPSVPAKPGDNATEEEQAAYNAVMQSNGNQLERAYEYLRDNAGGFNPDIWEILGEEENRQIIFKSMKNSATADFVIDTLYPDGKIAAGFPIAITAKYATEWTVTGIEDGEYTIANGYLTVNESVAINTAFTVTAKYTDIYGTLHTASKEFTVSKTVQAEEMNEVIYGINRGDLQIDMKDGEVVTVVTVDDSVVDYTYAGNTLNIAAKVLAGFGSRESHTLKIVANSETSVTEYTAMLSIYDFAIGSVDEWKAFEQAKGTVADAWNVASPSKHFYVVLTDDIDFGGEEYVPPRTRSDSWYSIDGREHTVSNVLTNSNCHGFLGDIHGTADERAYVKNIIFKNIKKTDGNHGALLCLDAMYVDFENLYIEGEVNVSSGETNGGIIGRAGYGNAGSVKFKNVVVNIKLSNQKNAVTCPSMLYENVYAISSTSNGNLGGVTVENGKAELYQTVEDFAAAKADITLGDAWTLTDTELKLFGTTVLTFEQTDVQE